VLWYLVAVLVTVVERESVSAVNAPVPMATLEHPATEPWELVPQATTVQETDSV